MQLSFPIYRLKHQAKCLARETKVPLHRALDEIAHREGYQSWAHLASSQANAPSVETLLAACHPGELMLIAARPEQGKTLLGLELLQLASKSGRDAWFFTLDYTERDLDSTDMTGIHLDTSDDISAAHIVHAMQQAKQGSIAVIDYLQILDQRRNLPPLAEQVTALKRFAMARQITIIALSQIDRRFDTSAGALPGPDDIRLPNPFDLGQISMTCFLHNGQARIAHHAP